MTKILFIDDEPDIHDFFEFIVEQIDGAELHAFTSQLDASAYIRGNNTPDFMFIDWRMPEGNAENFVLNHKDELHFTKKFLVTGELELNDDQKYYFDDVIYKPFTSERIKQIVGNAKP